MMRSPSSIGQPAYGADTSRHDDGFSFADTEAPTRASAHEYMPRVMFEWCYHLMSVLRLRLVSINDLPRQFFESFE